MRYLILMSLLFLSCTKEDAPIPKSFRTDSMAQQALSGVTLTAYDSATRVWELTSESMVRTQAQSEALILYPVHLLMFNPQGSVTTTVTSDSGSTSNKMDTFYIWGNVHILNDDGSRILSKSLSWSQKNRRLNSKERVIISTSTGEKISGVGFDAAEDFSEWFFYDSVYGEFNDIEDEMGLSDDDEE